MELNEGFTESNPRTCAVLFGRGFIGKSLVVKLLRSENWIVRIADSSPSLLLDPSEKNSVLEEALETGRASYFKFDIRDKHQVCRAVEGSSVVFHMDASDSSTEDFYLSHVFIVQGMKNVINACRECKVKKLIYNSSADVIFDGIHGLHNVDESLPYPWKFEDMLSDLKAQAEAMVLFANSTEGLSTCALRPSNVFGPGDPYLVPLLIQGAKAGWSKFIFGNGKNICDLTYVDNIAHAHICAEQALNCGTASAAGKAFFITNLEQRKLWDFISLMLEGLGYGRPTFRLPTELAILISVSVEWICRKLGYPPQLTPAVVRLLSCTRTFNCSAAKKYIGYSSIVTLEEGVALTIESCSHLAADSPYSKYRDFNDPSKVYSLLGSGKVADMLLWREEKRTFTVILLLVLMFYWFCLSGRTFISSTAKLIQFILIILFSHRFLPSSMLGFKVEKISPSYFEVSETLITDIFISLSSAWNKWIHILRCLAQGNNWNMFLKVIGCLYFLKLLISLSFSTLFGIGLVSMFTVFCIYEQNEEEIDRLVKASAVSVERLTGLLMSKLPLWLMEFLQNSQILDKGVVAPLKHQ